MAQEYSRSRRVGEQVQRELAPMVRRLAQDGGLGLVTITHVDVSPDLAHAKVLVSILGAPRGSAHAVSELNESAGALRHHLAHSMRLRSVPRLRFVFDESVEEAARINALLDEVRPPEADDAGRSDED